MPTISEVFGYHLVSGKGKTWRPLENVNLCRVGIRRTHVQRTTSQQLAGRQKDFESH